MIHFAVAFGLLLHVLFWGAGAASWLMPRPWARFWPVLILPVGLALQSAVVWAGAHAGLRGTNSYAYASECVPAGLLALALWHHGIRRMWTDLTRFGLVWASVAGCLVLLVVPVAIASGGLTTLSLGSCDAADYAAGARVLMEFARGDREGFLGLTEVVQVQSVDNVFDFWLRLNHFTPSALMALNGSVIDCSPHETATLMTAVLLAGALPVVFWIARAVTGYSGAVSLVVTGLFGVGPIMWYAVAHVSPAQLIAAPAIALITWGGVALWRGRLTWRRGAMFAGVLAVGYWLVLGSYNFIVVVCLVPAIAYAGGLALWRGRWRRFAGWLGVMLAPLAVCAMLFWARVAGLVERFTLFQTYDFGWRIPALTAEGWLGMVQGGSLEPWTFFGLRWILSAMVVGLLAWAFIRAAQQRRSGAWIALSLSVPVLAGYLYLQIRGVRLGTNASYDAYKLFAVFYPLILPALCWWVTLRRSHRLHEWLFVWGVAAVIVGFNVAACGMFMWKMSHAPLRVDGDLRQLRKIEAMPDVTSVNLLVPDMWSRLWANAFLLRKEQYFPTHTYEGRLNTPLRGEWDLEGGIVALRLPGDARRQITTRFALVDTRHPAFVRVGLEDGWYPAEHVPGAGEVWRWTKGEATVRIDNPQPHPVTIDVGLEGWTPVEQKLSLTRAGAETQAAAGAEVAMGKQRGTVRLPALVVPPGGSKLELRADTPPFFAPGDPRALGVSIFRINVTPR